MPLSKISLKNFRCFDEINFSLSSGINFFYGSNGSGKTSILEAVYIFSSGKSFKSSNLISLINYDRDKFCAKGYDNKKGYIVDIEKNRNKPISVVLNNKKITASKLLKEFPCTAIHNSTFSFADASPDFRRKLLDRSIFTADESYTKCWFTYYRTLKQRNSLLKNNRISDIYTWNQKLSIEGDKLNNYRTNFFNKTITEFKLLLDLIKPNDVFDFFDVIDINFFQGWETKKNLNDVLDNNLSSDLKRKTTIAGPHKADIKFLIKKIDARQVLSRGEQKFFSILWSCAQHEVLKKQFKVHATLLVDDIKSELDDRVFNLFLNLLNHVDTQIIFSCIDDCFSSKITKGLNNFKKFHVEHLRQL